jgi:hypothetical protein
MSKIMQRKNQTKKVRDAAKIRAMHNKKKE